jgi:hypothetical protein
MTLTDAAYSGITGHLSQSINAVGKQKGSTPHTRRGQTGFGASVAATDNDYFKLLRVFHSRPRVPVHTVLGVGDYTRAYLVDQNMFDGNTHVNSGVSQSRFTPG